MRIIILTTAMLFYQFLLLDVFPASAGDFISKGANSTLRPPLFFKERAEERGKRRVLLSSIVLEVIPSKMSKKDFKIRYESFIEEIEKEVVGLFLASWYPCLKIE